MSGDEIRENLRRFGSLVAGYQEPYARVRLCPHGLPDDLTLGELRQMFAGASLIALDSFAPEGMVYLDSFDPFEAPRWGTEPPEEDE